MTTALSRRGRAALLSLVAVAGLAALPVLHAQSHAGAEARAKEEATRTAFALGFLPHRTSAQETALRRAAALAFGERGQQRDAPPLHLHEGAPIHSHGGPGHGEGALEHLGLALALSAPPPGVQPT